MSLKQLYMQKCAGIDTALASMIVGGGIGASGVSGTENIMDGAAMGALAGLGVHQAFKMLNRDRTTRGMNPEDMKRLKKIYAKR